MVREAKGSAQKLLELVVENFESFRDEVEYAGKKGNLCCVVDCENMLENKKQREFE